MPWKTQIDDKKYKIDIVSARRHNIFVEYMITAFLLLFEMNFHMNLEKFLRADETQVAEASKYISC